MNVVINVKLYFMVLRLIEDDCNGCVVLIDEGCGVELSD